MAICARQRACARERSAQARFWRLPRKFSDKASTSARACRMATAALAPLVAGHSWQYDEQSSCACAARFALSRETQS